MVTLSNHLKKAVPQDVLLKLSKNQSIAAATLLTPKDLRKHLNIVFAYFKICSDLADGIPDKETSYEMLDWYRNCLHLCYEGKCDEPLFELLGETITKFNIPMKPFDDFIAAFLRDKEKNRYETFAGLEDYCKYSAHPVGRIFLYMMGHDNSYLQELSDCACTALQMISFMQDVKDDYLKGRIYLPKEDLDKFGYKEEDIANEVTNEAFLELMRFESERASKYLERGEILADCINGSGSKEARLFVNFAYAALNKLAKNNYNVYHKKVRLTKAEKIIIIIRLLWDGV